MKESLVHVITHTLSEMKRQHPEIKNIEEFELPDERFVRDLYAEAGGPTPVIGSRIPWLNMKFNANFVVKKDFRERILEKFKRLKT